ncbi:hypothetical protein JOB18_029479 [Solea senegalensis]|uniref:Uncharacterized protein n=1 Tax=Solea senegalensis TaxID=28829 RepID=A0AAV6Q259_SOLSE|nr:hypothetical protein JOB18_029479 [Solea senegalensis]
MSAIVRSSSSSTDSVSLQLESSSALFTLGFRPPLGFTCPAFSSGNKPPQTELRREEKSADYRGTMLYFWIHTVWIPAVAFLFGFQGFPVRSVDMQRATDNITIRQGDTAIIRNGTLAYFLRGAQTNRTLMASVEADTLTKALMQWNPGGRHF